MTAMSAGKHRVKPQRSFTGRMAILLVKLAALPVIAFILFYGAMTAWWYSGEVVIGRDVVGEIVARSAKAAGPAPAWPGVAQAFARIDPLGGGLSMATVHPNNPHWEQWMEFAEQHGDQITALRESLDHESLGIFATMIQPDGAGWVYDSPDTGPTPIATGLDIVTPLVNVFTESRWIQQLLLIHAWRSIVNNDQASAVDDLIAAIRYAEQTRETSFLISDIFAIGMHTRAVDGALWVLEAHPGVFTADDLGRLRAANDAFMGGDIRFVLDDERLLSHDSAQRMFTDNGSGDGHAVVYYPRFEMFVDNDIDSGREASLIGPLWLPFAPTRKEFEAMSDRCFDAIRVDTLAPPWQFRQSEVHLLKNELERTRQSQQRWNLHLMLLGGGFFSLDNIIDRARMKQSSASTILAMHEYRLVNGDWPPTLVSLVPEFIDQLPVDSYTGQPLLFMIDPATNTPILYSAGEDGDDDGGVPVRADKDPWSSMPDDGDMIFWPSKPPPVEDSEN